MASVVLGGGGSVSPDSELLLELVTALLAVTWLSLRRQGDRTIGPTAMLFAALILALPVLQLLPLPPAIWRSLPGRATEVAALDLVGAGRTWMPWSVSPPRTWAALLAVLPAAFVLVITSSLDRDGRRALLVTIAALGFVSLVLGALQLADGGERTWRFYADNPGYLNGFQANRNAEADVLLIALAALVSLLPSWTSDRTRAGLSALVVAGAAALLLGCILTGSRAGIVLALPITILLLLLQWRARITWSRRIVLVAGAGAAMLASLVVIQAPGSAIGRTVARFSWQRDVRLDLWRDTLPALRSVWPAGSGVGTFRPIFIAAEPLSSVDPTWPVRAHNDYLEFALEGGLAAIIVVAACLVIAAVAFVRAARGARPCDRSTLVFIAATWLVLALHSLVDYPLRSMALAMLGAAASGMLLAVVREPDRSDRATGDRVGLMRG